MGGAGGAGALGTLTGIAFASVVSHFTTQAVEHARLAAGSAEPDFARVHQSIGGDRASSDLSSYRLVPRTRVVGPLAAPSVAMRDLHALAGRIHAHVPVAGGMSAWESMERQRQPQRRQPHYPCCLLHHEHCSN